MDTSTHHVTSLPLSVREIAEKAVAFDYDPLIRLRYWLRTAETLYKEAVIYQAEGNEQQAYLLLLRHAELAIRYLPKHPETAYPENRHALVQLQHRLSEVLKRLEYLKPRIHARHENYLAALREREARRAASASSSSLYSIPQRQSRRSSAPKPLDLPRLGSVSSTGPFSPPLDRGLSSGSGSTYDGLEIARQEFERREREKRAKRRQQALEQGRGVPLDSWGREIKRVSTPNSAAVAESYRALRAQYAQDTRNGYAREEERARWQREEEERARWQREEEDRARWQREEEDRVRWQREEEDRARWQREEEELDLARSIEALHMKAEAATARHMMPEERDYLYWGEERERDRNRDKRERERERERQTGSWKGSYPSVPKRQRPPPRLPPPLPEPAVETIEIRSATPTPPPKMPLGPHSPPVRLETSPPPIPVKTPLLPSRTPSPPVRSTTKDFSTPATLENGKSLRTIFLPSSLRQQFLLIAAPNTARNLETCGILCGTLIQNALFVSRLVIPEQDATSDTCTTKDEEKLFDYCDKEDLMVLGWIHTHPTQTCFMSSVDLHTHCAYQCMLPESIAIVCAPRHEPSWGVFRLTDPPGVTTIRKCKQKGLFHPHGEKHVYTDAMRPGHVCEVRDMGFDLVDLRGKD